MDSVGGETMDPVSVWALAVKAIAEMVTEIVKGQSPELLEIGR